MDDRRFGQIPLLAFHGSHMLEYLHIIYVYMYIYVYIYTHHNVLHLVKENERTETMTQRTHVASAICTKPVEGVMDSRGDRAVKSKVIRAVHIWLVDYPLVN